MTIVATSGQVGPKPEALHKPEVPYTPYRLMKAGNDFLLISHKSRPLSCRFKMSLPASAATAFSRQRRQSV